MSEKRHYDKNRPRIHSDSHDNHHVKSSQERRSSANERRSSTHERRSSTNERGSSSSDRHSKSNERHSGGHEMPSSSHDDLESTSPPRYSPPPSLKPYTIPRRAGQKSLLKQTSLESREGKFVIDSIKKSLWNPDATCFDFMKLELVNNERLEAEYIGKRKEMKEQNRSNSEISDCIVFLYLRTKEECRDVCLNGLSTKRQYYLPTGSSCSIGDKKYGIYLCRCADVITRKAPLYQYGKENIMLLCKIMKGRLKVIQDTDQKVDDDNLLEPTPDFDGHVSRRFQRGIKMNYDLIYDASQIYLYEMNLDNFSIEDDTAIFSKRPRQCLPYAILYFRAKQNIPTTIEPVKVPLKVHEEKSQVNTNALNGLGNSTAADASGLPEQTYDDCLKNMRFVWKGFYYIKDRFLSEIQIGVFSKRDLCLPLDIPNLCIQQRISWDKLNKIFPAKIFRKPPCRSLQPETDVVGFKFLHAEIHPLNHTSNAVQLLLNCWLKKSMAGVCTLSTGYKLYILPSSVFTDKLGMTDLSYPAVLHCIFMKESTENTCLKGFLYEQFILRQQFALQSRLMENEDLKKSNADVNNCVQRKYAYSLTERQTISKFISQIRRAQEKRGVSKQVDPIKKSIQNSNVQNVMTASTKKIDTFDIVNLANYGNVAPQSNISNLMNYANNIPPNNISALLNYANALPPSNISTSCAPPNVNINSQTDSSVPKELINIDIDKVKAVITSLLSPQKDGQSDISSEEAQPLIDFCLSFKREGSARTTRVKLFPNEPSSKKQAISNELSSKKQAISPMNQKGAEFNVPSSNNLLTIASSPNIILKDTQPVSSSANILSKNIPQQTLPSSPIIPQQTFPPSNIPPKKKPVHPSSLKVPPKNTQPPLPSPIPPKDIQQPILPPLPNIPPKTTEPIYPPLPKSPPRTIQPVLPPSPNENRDCRYTSPKDNAGNTTDSSQDSEDNLVINLDDNLDTDIDIDNVAGTKQDEKCGKGKREDIVNNHSTVEGQISDTSSVNDVIVGKSDMKDDVNDNMETSFSSDEYPMENLKDTIQDVDSSNILHDNYENLTMDEGSENSQDTSQVSTSNDDPICEDDEDNHDIRHHDDEDNNGVNDDDLIDDDDDDNDGNDNNANDDDGNDDVGDKGCRNERAKCESPSLSQLNSVKEQILQQLSLLKARNLKKKKLELTHEDSGSGYESEIIPFLGEKESGEESASEEVEKLLKNGSEKVKPPKKIDKKFWAKGLNLEKAQMAIMAIGSEYYEQISPGLSDPPSLKVSPVPISSSIKSSSIPTTSDRPVLKVLPVAPSASHANLEVQINGMSKCSVSTISSVSQSSSMNLVLTTTSALSSTPVITVTSAPSSPVNSEDSQIPFLSDDPSDKVLNVPSHDTNLPASPTPIISRPPPLPLIPNPVTSRPPPLPLIPDQSMKKVSGESSPIPPKRPIMEVSPVVRSSSGPWMSHYPNRGIAPLITTGNQPCNFPYPRNDAPYRDLKQLIQGGTVNVNRDKGGDMFSMEDASERNFANIDSQVSPGRRKLQLLRDSIDGAANIVPDNSRIKMSQDPIRGKVIPRAYRQPMSARSHISDDDSALIIARSYRNSPRGDVSQTSGSDPEWKHHSRRRSRSPHSHRRRYHRSHSRSPQRRKDRSPRYRGYASGDREVINFRKVYGLDLEEEKGDRSPLFTPYDDSRWEIKESYRRNDPNESLDEYLHKQQHLIRPQSLPEGEHRFRRNSSSNEERQSDEPSTSAPIDYRDSHAKNEMKNTVDTTTVQTETSTTIEEKVNRQSSKDKGGMNPTKTDLAVINVPNLKASQKNGSKNTGCNITSVKSSPTSTNKARPNSTKKDSRPRGFVKVRGFDSKPISRADKSVKEKRIERLNQWYATRGIQRHQIGEVNIIQNALKEVKKEIHKEKERRAALKSGYGKTAKRSNSKKLDASRKNVESGEKKNIGESGKDGNAETDNIYSDISDTSDSDNDSDASSSDTSSDSDTSDESSESSNVDNSCNSNENEKSATLNNSSTVGSCLTSTEDKSSEACIINRDEKEHAYIDVSSDTDANNNACDTSDVSKRHKRKGTSNKVTTISPTMSPSRSIAVAANSIRLSHTKPIANSTVVKSSVAVVNPMVVVTTSTSVRSSTSIVAADPARTSPNMFRSISMMLPLLIENPTGLVKSEEGLDSIKKENERDVHTSQNKSDAHTSQNKIAPATKNIKLGNRLSSNMFIRGKENAVPPVRDIFEEYCLKLIDQINKMDQEGSPR